MAWTGILFLVHTVQTVQVVVMDAEQRASTLAVGVAVENAVSAALKTAQECGQLDESFVDVASTAAQARSAAEAAMSFCFATAPTQPPSDCAGDENDEGGGEDEDEDDSHDSDDSENSDNDSDDESAFTSDEEEEEDVESDDESGDESDGEVDDGSVAVATVGGPENKSKRPRFE
jgi:hypothetical protein